MRAAVLLSFKQDNDPIGFGWVSSQAFYPVSPVPVIGAFLSLYFDMPLDGNISVLDEGGGTVVEVQAVSFPMLVAMHPPGVAFVRMAPFGPTG